MRLIHQRVTGPVSGVQSAGSIVAVGASSLDFSAVMLPITNPLGYANILGANQSEGSDFNTQFATSEFLPYPPGSPAPDNLVNWIPTPLPADYDPVEPLAFELIPQNPGALYYGAVLVDSLGDNIIVGEYGYWTHPGSVFTSSDRGTVVTNRGVVGPGSYMGSGCSNSDNSIAYLGCDGFDGIYKSTNSGTSWALTTAPIRNWYDMDCSTDGTRVFAAGYNNYVHRSLDSGSTWDSVGNSSSWYSVCCSDDGLTVYSVDSNGVVWKTTDSGTMFSEIATLDSLHKMIDCSSDGSKVITCSGGASGRIQLSDDGGDSWYYVGPTKDWNRVRSSDDGNVLMASVYGEYLYVSYDRGSTWDVDTNIAGAWQAINMNSTGTRLYALNWGVGVYRNVI